MVPYGWRCYKYSIILHSSYNTIQKYREKKHCFVCEQTARTTISTLIFGYFLLSHSLSLSSTLEPLSIALSLFDTEFADAVSTWVSLACGRARSVCVRSPMNFPVLLFRKLVMYTRIYVCIISIWPFIFTSSPCHAAVTVLIVVFFFSFFFFLSLVVLLVLLSLSRPALCSLYRLLVLV